MGATAQPQHGCGCGWVRWMIHMDGNMTQVVDIHCVSNVVKLLSGGLKFLATPLTESLWVFGVCVR